ncbi:hypothetical protein BU23DRAFT_258882 [Bimuria novae-zelandiae CBS 107.79]|uniref:Uncharacterized protein n=1 Tax=Bimuria novae-zelandiae CBS 107.79 TaxID=1447943 RepID=A0A6A5V607_9PLEO|nr:hypothetical protein BU23DRAFT_258882 [Bimuria novae-zelandiae CBS 107.79]
MTGSAIEAVPKGYKSNYYKQPSFFEHLNYDVRQIIYKHMEKHLPPVSDSLEFAGFALSCKQAYNEVCQPAMTGLKQFLEDFQRNFEQYAGTSTRIIPNIPSHSTFEQLRHITIRIPPSLVIGSFDTQLDKAVLALRPILSGYFQKVTLLFVDPENQYPPNFRSGLRVSSGHALFRLAQIIMDERKVQSSVKALSKYVSKVPNYQGLHPSTSVQPARRDFDFTGTLLHQGRDLPRPVSTTEIQIAWDWRDEETISTPVELRGYRHEYELRSSGQSERSRPQLYVVGNKDRSVGMQGITCKERWSVSESVRLYWLLQEHRYKSLRGYCWSEGIGKEVRDGLGGMSAKEFQERNPPLVLAALF